MLAWIEVFETHIRPLHQRLGMTIHGAWQALDTNTFIWIRGFETEAAIDVLEAAYSAHQNEKPSVIYPSN